ncbi:MAG: hypothetical protein AAFU71_00645 [Cyanobacteria bacterium J06632_22]
MLVYYGIPAGIVFLVALSAYLRDTAVPKNRPFDWLFILVTALLWPVTAPFIAWKKVTALLADPPKNEGVELRSQPVSKLEALYRRQYY